MHIKYKNLTIRDAVAADAEQLVTWWNNGAVMAHAGFPNGLGTAVEKVIAGLGNGRLILKENELLIEFGPAFAGNIHKSVLRQ